MLKIQDGSLTTFSKRTVAMQLSPCSAALQVEDGVSPWGPTARACVCDREKAGIEKRPLL